MADRLASGHATLELETRAQIEFRQDLHTPYTGIKQRLFLWKRGVEMEFRYLLSLHLQQDTGN